MGKKMVRVYLNGHMDHNIKDNLKIIIYKE